MLVNDDGLQYLILLTSTCLRSGKIEHNMHRSIMEKNASTKKLQKQYNGTHRQSYIYIVVIKIVLKPNL